MWIQQYIITKGFDAILHILSTKQSETVSRIYGKQIYAFNVISEETIDRIISFYSSNYYLHLAM